MFPSITVFIEHTCAVGNCKHKRIPCRQLSLDEVFVDYITPQCIIGMPGCHIICLNPPLLQVRRAAMMWLKVYGSI